MSVVPLPLDTESQMEARPGIYEIRNLGNGHRYIGSTANMRKRQWEHLCALRKGKHHSRYLQRAWFRYGAERFVFEVVECVSDVACLIEREQHYLDTICPAYNLSPTAGSNRGAEHTEAMRLANSMRLKGRTLSPEHCLNISRSLKGRVFTEEQRRRMSEAQIGKKASDETRAKLRASHLGIKPSAATVEKRNRILRQLWKDPAYIQRRSEASRRMWADPKTRPILTAARRRGSAHPLTTLTEEQVHEIKEMLREGKMRQTQIAGLYGVGRHVVWSIKHGKTWGHVD